MADEYDTETDPSVPADLLELYVELEERAVTPQEFKEVFGEASDES